MILTLSTYILSASRFSIAAPSIYRFISYKNKLVWTGPPVPPDANEMGWKDTVRVAAALVTRIIIKFEGYAGRYVWHCHVLEHEDNEMRRPYDVLS
jgi:FtsP/CotA-like multicopper oxidase with cupredoxin domain